MPRVCPLLVQKYAKNAQPLINTNAIPITGFKIVPLLSHSAIDPTKNDNRPIDVYENRTGNADIPSAVAAANFLHPTV